MTDFTILVTGGCGYIGSHLVYQLKKAYQVIVVDDLSTGDVRNQFEGVQYHIGDIGDSDFLRGVFKQHNIQSVVHMAAKTSVEESMKNPELYYKENSDNTIQLMHICGEFSVKQFLFSSTAAVYGETKTQPVNENAKLAPCSVYGESKLMAEQGLQDLAPTLGISLSIFRYFNVSGNQSACAYGSFRKEETTLIQKIAAHVANGNYNVSIYGNGYDTPDGTCVRDYVHVSDIANAHALLIKKDLPKLTDTAAVTILNIGYGQGLSVLEVVNLFDQILPTPLTHQMIGKRVGDLPVSIADSSKLQQELGWTSLFSSPYEEIVESALLWAKKRISV